MGTDDDAAPKLSPAPTASEPRDADKGDRLNERLTERIRQSTQPGPNDDKLNETIRQRLEHLVPELVKKTFAAGMGAVFSTEEGIRKIAREVSLPDVVGYVASSADGAKDKVFEIVARETRDFLANLNLTEEVAKILTTLSLEIKTEIRFIPNSERITGAEPDVKASVRLKRNDRGPAPDRKDERSKDERSKDERSKDERKDDELEDPRDSRARLRFWRREGEPAEPGDGDDGSHDR